jgi:hypothetical protein
LKFVEEGEEQQKHLPIEIKHCLSLFAGSVKSADIRAIVCKKCFERGDMPTSNLKICETIVSICTPFNAYARFFAPKTPSQQRVKNPANARWIFFVSYQAAQSEKSSINFFAQKTAKNRILAGLS